jgi:hypothetical protein
MRGFGRLAPHLLINLADLSLSFVLESRHFGRDKMIFEVFLNTIVVSVTREVLLSFGGSELKLCVVPDLVRDCEGRRSTKLMEGMYVNQSSFVCGLGGV